jgi:large-conductance mechanosensitive channel
MSLIIDPINPFLNFLQKFNILPVVFSLIISLNLNQLSNSFIETMVSPIINRLFIDSDVKLKERIVIIWGIKLEFGKFLINLIQFFLTLYLLYLLYLLYNYINNNTLDLNIPKSTIMTNLP